MGARASWKSALAMAAALAAQQSPAPPPTPPLPPPQEAPGGVFRLPPAWEPPKEAPPPKVEEPKKPLIENTGQPMRIPFDCTDDDIQAFGMTCTEQDPCPVYAELVAVQPLGTRIFLTGNFHNGSATMYSLLLATGDEGKTWNEPVERIRGAGLEQIQFFDFETGWIGGQQLGALPRDPFFLLTTDGGQIWRKRPVFSESRIATIDKFWFDSRTSGTMTLDRAQGAENNARYELYESMTGGESWMIRQISPTPIALKGVRDTESSTGWRLRTDAKTRSYVIERREGTRRVPVATFLVQAGECKPSPSALPEPPAPPEPAVEPQVPRTPPRGPPTLKKP